MYRGTIIIIGVQRHPEGHVSSAVPVENLENENICSDCNGAGQSSTIGDAAGIILF